MVAVSSDAAGDFLRVGAEALEQAVLDDDREAERDQDDEQHVLADDALQQEALQPKPTTNAIGSTISVASTGLRPSDVVSTNSTKLVRTMKSPCAMLTKRITPADSDRPVANSVYRPPSRMPCKI